VAKRPPNLLLKLLLLLLKPLLLQKLQLLLLTLPLPPLLLLTLPLPPLLLKLLLLPPLLLKPQSNLGYLASKKPAMPAFLLPEARQPHHTNCRQPKPAA